jgi:hypothetical protein
MHIILYAYIPVLYSRSEEQKNTGLGPATVPGKTGALVACSERFPGPGA